MKLKYFISTAFILGVSANAQAQKWFNCKACPAGTYSDGVHGCKTCSAGTYSSSVGASSCTACTGKPDHASWTSGCSWKCDSGYWEYGGKCYVQITSIRGEYCYGSISSPTTCSYDNSNRCSGDSFNTYRSSDIVFRCGSSDTYSGWNFSIEKLCGPTGCYATYELFKTEKEYIRTVCDYDHEAAAAGASYVASGCSDEYRYYYVRIK
ncbi:MAG: hypothetical protein K6F04_00195 [bacterium]|nr:hypothetical protein [bacterium]